MHLTLAGAPELSRTGGPLSFWSTSLGWHLAWLEISAARKLGNCALLPICAINFRRLRHRSNLRRDCTGKLCVVDFRTSDSKSVLVLGCVSICLDVPQYVQICVLFCVVIRGRVNMFAEMCPCPWKCHNVRINTDVSEFRACAWSIFCWMEL